MSDEMTNIYWSAKHPLHLEIDVVTRMQYITICVQVITRVIFFTLICNQQI